MANFQTSLTVTPPIAAQCNLIIQDSSNYTGNTQSGHSQSDFSSFFKVKITRPNTTTYVYDAQGNGDVVVNNPSTTIFNRIYNFNNPNDANGTYGVKLYSVPTYNATASYTSSTNDVVYYNGILWAAVTVAPFSGSTPSMTNTDWVAINENTLEVSYPRYYTTTNVVVTCLTPTIFQASLIDQTTKRNSIDVDTACSKLTIVDNANYTTNSEVGHTLSDFSDYIRIEITNPDNDVYVMSSVTGTDVDETIQVPSTGVHTFNHLFSDTDTDGIYTVTICSYPTWDINYAYIYPTGHIIVVYFNGILYKLLADSTGDQPDVSPTQWEVYQPSNADNLLTRYCTVEKLIILCRSILSCYETIVHKAFCEIDSDFCNDDILCKNRDFLNATKMNLLLEQIEFSVDRQQWNEIEKIIDLMKSICNCG